MKTRLKKAPALLLSVLIAMSLASCAAPHDAASVISTSSPQAEAATSSVTVEPSSSTSTPVSTSEESTSSVSTSAPPSEASVPSKTPLPLYSTPVTSSASSAPSDVHPQIVFWEDVDKKIHVDPGCMTIPDDTPLNGCFKGTLEEARAAGHNEWCSRCSILWNEEWFKENGNPFLDTEGNLINGDLVDAEGNRIDIRSVGSKALS